MSDLGFSVSYKSVQFVSWKSTMRILFPSPILTNFPSTKQGHESKRTKSKTCSCGSSEKAVNLEWTVFNFFLEFFFEGVSLVLPTLRAESPLIFLDKSICLGRSKETLLSG